MQPGSWHHTGLSTPLTLVAQSYPPSATPRFWYAMRISCVESTGGRDPYCKLDQWKYMLCGLVQGPWCVQEGSHLRPSSDPLHGKRHRSRTILHNLSVPALASTLRASQPKVGVHVRCAGEETRKQYAANVNCGTIVPLTRMKQRHLNTFQPPPPPRSGEKNPTFRRNVPASRFFSKTGSQCPGSQSQGPNTPPFWLFCSWSYVETQSFPQFAKKNFHLSVCTWFLISDMSESATGPVAYALAYRLTSVGSNPTN